MDTCVDTREMAFVSRKLKVMERWRNFNIQDSHVDILWLHDTKAVWYRIGSVSSVNQPGLNYMVNELWNKFDKKHERRTKYQILYPGYRQQ
jgi:hypothetical protein